MNDGKAEERKWLGRVLKLQGIGEMGIEMATVKQVRDEISKK